MFLDNSCYRFYPTNSIVRKTDTTKNVSKRPSEIQSTNIKVDAPEYRPGIAPNTIKQRNTGTKNTMYAGKAALYIDTYSRIGFII